MSANVRMLTEFGELNNSNNTYNIIFQEDHISVSESVFEWIANMISNGSIANSFKFVYNYNTFEVYYKSVSEDSPEFDQCYVSINNGTPVSLNSVLPAFSLFQDTINLNKLIDADVFIDLRNCPV